MKVFSDNFLYGSPMQSGIVTKRGYSYCDGILAAEFKWRVGRLVCWPWWRTRFERQQRLSQALTRYGFGDNVDIRRQFAVQMTRRAKKVTCREVNERRALTKLFLDGRHVV